MWYCIEKMTTTTMMEKNYYKIPSKRNRHTKQKRKREILLLLVLLMNTVDPLHKLNRWSAEYRREKTKITGINPFSLLSRSLSRKKQNVEKWKKMKNREANSTLSSNLSFWCVLYSLCRASNPLFSTNRNEKEKSR